MSLTPATYAAARALADERRQQRIRHRVYGPGHFVRLLPEPGQCRAVFDIDGAVPRRVLVRDLAVERVEVTS